MNFSGSGFRYKVLEANVLSKYQNTHSSFESKKQPQKHAILNYPTNTYQNKKYSTIKSLMRRLQATGQVNVNYPRIKARNQRNDIFLRGGSINQIKKNEFFQQAKFTNKKSPLNNKKAFMKLNFDKEYMQQIHEVFISKNRPLDTRKEECYRNHQSVKTEAEKNEKSSVLSGFARTLDKKFVVETPMLVEQLDFKAFQQGSGMVEVRMKGNQRVESNEYEFSTKFQRSKALISLRNTEATQSKISKRTSSNTEIKKIHQNLSQNSIPAFSSESRKIKVNHKIVKSIISLKSETKKSSECSQVRKPLFYLSQDELKSLSLTTKSFIVMEYPSKQIVTGSYFRQVAEIASLTKIITFYCCLLLIQKHNLNINEEILVIDQQVESTTGTSAELQEGDVFTFRSICYGLMLPSGNDAALAMAKWGGKIIKNHQTSETQSDLKVFMAFMNSTCLSIGMKSSFFGNPHGLPHPKSGSTVEDVALIIHQALKIQFFREVIKTKSYKCWVQNNGIKRQVLWQNTNKLLRRNGFVGVKTGVTVTAGPCLSTCYETGDKIYITVLVKTSKLSKRFKETRKILGKVLAKINYNLYKKEIREIEKNDVEFDSDNSEDEQEFNYDRNDAQEMKKRLKIITYEM